MAFTQHASTGLQLSKNIKKIELGSDTAGTASEIITINAHSMHSPVFGYESIHGKTADSDIGSAVGSNVTLSFVWVGLGDPADWVAIDELINGESHVEYIKIKYDDGREKVITSGVAGSPTMYFKISESDDGDAVKEVRFEGAFRGAYISQSAT